MHSTPRTSSLVTLAPNYRLLSARARATVSGATTQTWLHYRDCRDITTSLCIYTRKLALTCCMWIKKLPHLRYTFL